MKLAGIIEEGDRCNKFIFGLQYGKTYLRLTFSLFGIYLFGLEIKRRIGYANPYIKIKIKILLIRLSFSIEELIIFSYIDRKLFNRRIDLIKKQG